MRAACAARPCTQRPAAQERGRAASRRIAAACCQHAEEAVDGAARDEGELVIVGRRAAVTQRLLVLECPEAQHAVWREQAGMEREVAVEAQRKEVGVGPPPVEGGYLTQPTQHRAHLWIVTGSRRRGVDLRERDGPNPMSIQ
eukprot:1523426-Prymnesium_polylepis.2